jgi:hypothetical protein
LRRPVLKSAEYASLFRPTRFSIAAHTRKASTTARKPADMFFRLTDAADDAEARS